MTLEPDPQIWAIHQDANGYFWFGSNGQGIYQHDGQTLHQLTTSDGLVDNTIREIHEDHLGNLYIETPKGISQFDGTSFHTLPILPQAESSWENAPTDLWFNGIGDYLYRFDGQQLHDLQLPEQDLSPLGLDTNVPLQEQRFSPYAVYGINKDDDGNVWFGTVKAGAFRFDGTHFLWFGEPELSTLPDGRVPGVRSILQDQEGYVWLSNFHSKYRINPDAPKGYDKLKAVDLPEALIGDKIGNFNDGFKDPNGNLWMITYGGGVWKYDGNQLTNIEVKNELGTVLLLCIAQDKEGTIWLGSRNDGIYKQNGSTFEKFNLQ
ncbi:MAG: two-component regulator propeller domain-containing protein [Bacteroidota bacterium]